MGRAVKYLGAIMVGLGVVDILQSMFTGKYIPEYINPITIQATSDATAQIIDYVRQASGVAKDALIIGVGTFLLHSNKIKSLEGRIGEQKDKE